MTGSIDDIESARARIVSALDLVLPGRVQPTPPSSRRYVTPSMWVDDPTMVEVSTTIVATFPVWIVVDGAIQAQIDGLDRLRWNAWLACAPFAGELAARPVLLSGYRAAVLDVGIGIEVGTLCGLPPPTAVVIEPHTTTKE